PRGPRAAARARRRAARSRARAARRAASAVGYARCDVRLGRSARGRPRAAPGGHRARRGEEATVARSPGSRPGTRAVRTRGPWREGSYRHRLRLRVRRHVAAELDDLVGDGEVMIRRVWRRVAARVDRGIRALE